MPELSDDRGAAEAVGLDPAVAQPVQRRTGGWVAELSLLVLLPIAAVPLLGISLVDQYGYVDPEFYTGYGQSFARMWQIFGARYYAVRFPVMFADVASQSLARGITGYALLRFAVFMLCALPVYALARRSYGRGVALSAYLFLLLNPLLPRILCWDLTTFLSIPAALAGMALWHVSSAAFGPAAIAVGFLFATSINSHVFTGTAILVFLLVETAFSLRTVRRLGWLALRALALAVGAAVCCALGMLFYRWQVGWVSPTVWLDSTIVAARAGREYTETHYLPLASYYAANYEIYVPLLTTALLVVAMRRRLFEDTVASRIVWFSIAYIAAYLVAVFGLHMNVVQYFWYFGHLTVVVFLGVVVLIGVLADSYAGPVGAWFCAGLLVPVVVMRLFFPVIGRLSSFAYGNGPFVAGFIMASVACLGALQSGKERAVVASIVLAGLLLQIPFLSRTHLSVYDRRANRVEFPLFRDVIRYQDILNRYDRPAHRVRTWYANRHLGFLSLASSNLLFTLQDPWTGPGMPSVNEYELAILKQAETQYVLLLAESASDITGGLSRLSDAGIRVSRRECSEWPERTLPVHACLVGIER